VSRLAAGLERKGWVRRGRDEANQRYIRLYLTPEGSRVAARVWSAWQTRQARILAALTIEERAGLASGLRGLIRGLAAEGLVADVPPPATVLPRRVLPRAVLSRRPPWAVLSRRPPWAVLSRRMLRAVLPRTVRPQRQSTAADRTAAVASGWVAELACTWAGRYTSTPSAW